MPCFVGGHRETRRRGIGKTRGGDKKKEKKKKKEGRPLGGDGEHAGLLSALLASMAAGGKARRIN